MEIVLNRLWIPTRNKLASFPQGNDPQVLGVQLPATCLSSRCGFRVLKKRPDDTHFASSKIVLHQESYRCDRFLVRSSLSLQDIHRAKPQCHGVKQATDRT